MLVAEHGLQHYRQQEDEDIEFVFLQLLGQPFDGK